MQAKIKFLKQQIDIVVKEKVDAIHKIRKMQSKSYEPQKAVEMAINQDAESIMCLANLHLSGTEVKGYFVYSLIRPLMNSRQKK